MKPFLALEASAGSGKTFALSVRYVALVLLNAKISEILAITFTNKAANEMKIRIIDTFLELHQAHKSNELQALCALLGKNEQEILALRDARKSEFLRSELKIKTFDSFFTSIVRSFSLNLGLMSDFELEENKVSANAEFIKLLSQKELEGLARFIISTKSTKEDFLKDLEFLYENSYSLPHSNTAYPAKELENISLTYQILKNYALPKSQNAFFKKNFSFETIDKNNIREFCEKSIIAEFESKKYFEIFFDDEEFLQKRNALLSSLNAYANALQDYKLGILMNFLNHFKKAKDTIIKEKNVLSFGDMAKKANELLTQNELKELIYFRLDGYIAHLLIDEFQDTSVLQYQILKPLIAEIVSGKGTRDFKSFFYVGDKKQSIYRFRHSKKELFDLLQKDFPQIQKESLKTNYRSKENIVNFINKQFSKLYANYESQESKIKGGGFVKIVRSNETQKDKKEIFEENFKTLTQHLEFLKAHNIKEDNICILCWKNEDADELVARLKEQKFKAYTQSKIVLDKNASVCLLINYAKYCIFGDEYYNELIKSLLGKEIQRIKLDIADNPAHIIHFLIQHLKLDLSDNALIQLLEYSTTKENFLELLFEPFTQTIANEAKGISIMTVHKSKGLEFDNVILLDTLSAGADNKGHNLMLEYDTEKKSWQLHFKDSIRKATKEQAYTEFTNKKELYDKEDGINKLYVAITRAKKSLFIIKRNEGQYSLFEDIECDEVGELENELISEEEVNFKGLDALMPFEKVPKQEKMPSSAKSDEIYFGKAFHYFMQHYNFKEESKNLRQMIKQKFHHFLDENAFNELFERIETLLLNAEFKELYKNKTLFKEQNLSFNGELKQLDLLCVDENEAVVVDYKTGISDEEGHKKQVRLYKKAIENILQKPKTSAFIVYCLKEGIRIEKVD